MKTACDENHICASGGYKSVCDLFEKCQCVNSCHLCKYLEFDIEGNSTCTNQAAWPENQSETEKKDGAE
jgi:hypothetical protein